MIREENDRDGDRRFLEGREFSHFSCFCKISRRQCYRVFSIIAPCRKITCLVPLSRNFSKRHAGVRVLGVCLYARSRVRGFFFRLRRPSCRHHAAFQSRPDGNTAARDRTINKLFYSRAISLFSDTRRPLTFALMSRSFVCAVRKRKLRRGISHGHIANVSVISRRADGAAEWSSANGMPQVSSESCRSTVSFDLQSSDSLSTNR